MDNAITPLPISRDKSRAAILTESALPVLKVSYGVGFEAPGSPSLVQSLQGDTGKRKSQYLEYFKAGIIFWRGSIRRNYLQPFDRNSTEVKRPDCFSSDGEMGSKPQEIVQYGAKKYYVFGECDSCLFSKFNSKGVHLNNGTPQSKAQQCSVYGLGLLWLNLDPTYGESGLPVLLQVPPTGGNLWRQMEEAALANNSIPEAFLWEFNATGGGKGGNNLSVSMSTPLSQIAYDKVRELQEASTTLIERAVERFTSGEDLSSVEVKDDRPVGRTRID